MEARYYADVDTKGDIVGFYLSDIHGDSIPGTAKRITEGQWREYIHSNGGRGHKWTGSGWLEKTQLELDAEVVNLPLAEKTSEQVKIEILQEKQLLIQNALDELIFGGVF